ncbi:MAG: serine protease [Candidatus Tumulicola sp.]
MAVHLVEDFANQPLHVWVEQMLKVAAHPTPIDASSAPVPIFPDAKASQVLGVGLVVAGDAAHSYVVTAASPRPAGPLFLGNPLAPGGWWRIVAASVVAYDAGTGLTLLSAAPLAIRPGALEATPLQGAPLSLLRYSFCSYQEMPDAVSCTPDVDAGIVVAVHSRYEQFEHSMTNEVFDADGAPIADSETHRVAGIALGPNLLGGAGSSVAISAAGISSFIRREAPAVASLQPAAEGSAIDPNARIVTRARHSIVSIRVFDPYHPRVQMAGTGVEVQQERAGALVLSAAHVLPSPKPAAGYRVTVTAFDSSPLQAEVRKVDLKHDLALFYVADLHLAALPVAIATLPGTKVASLGFSELDSRNFNDDSPELMEGTVGTVDQASGFVDYDLATSQGFSGGPVFDLDHGSLVGLVHGAVREGVGGYEGIGAAVIRAFIPPDPPDPSDPPLESAPVARVAASLALIDCPSSALTPAHETGVVVASDSRHSYIATAPVHFCQPVVHIGGNQQRSYNAREVSENAMADFDAGTIVGLSDNVDLLVINVGGLRPITLAPTASSTSHAYVLSYAASALAQYKGATVVPPRVDEAQVDTSSPYFESNNGIGEGGAILDAGYTHLLGIVSLNTAMQSLGSFDAHGRPLPPPPPDTRVRYSFASASAIDHRLLFSVDDVPYKQAHPLPTRFPVGTVLAVMQQGRLSGSPGDYTGFSNAVALGSKGGRSYFVSSLLPSDLNRLSLAFTDGSGLTQRLDAQLVANDTTTSLALLSTAQVSPTIPRWAPTVKTSSKVLVPYYSFCFWEPSRAASMHVRAYVLPACRYQAYWTSLAPGRIGDSLAIGAPGIVIGRACQGAPVINPQTFRFEGLANDCTFGVDTARVATFLNANGWTIDTR